MYRTVSLLTLLTFTLSACSPPSQSQYGDQDVGHNSLVLFGTVISERPVDIKGTNSGAGAGIGALGGGIAGSALGRGNGSLLGLLGGAVIGGIAGAVAEQSLKDRQGIEYIVQFPINGTTQSIVQNIAKKDQPIAEGECVMVQMNGTYQRVLPARDDSQCETPTKHSKHHKRYREHDDDGEN